MIASITTRPSSPAVYRDSLADIDGQAGFSTCFSINADELDHLRGLIFQQWITRIEAVHPEHADVFRSAGLANYHRFSHLVSHDELWTKTQRVLPLESVLAVRDYDSIRRLVAAFGHQCRISNVALVSGVVTGHPQVYWRLVRPHMPSDVGPIHTDKWFNDLLGKERQSLYDEARETTVKMWLAVHTEPGRNGLYVVPGSHRKSWAVRYSRGSDGYLRPALDEPLGHYAKQLVPTAPGDAILFNENLLHGGAVNGGSECRISIEITFVLSREPGHS